MEMLDGYQMMIPGPIQLEENVLREMGRQVVPHYGPEWTAYYNETITLLQRCFLSSGRVFPIPGSGSAALDAALGTLAGMEGRLLIESNGFFGDRLVDIATTHAPNVLVKRHPVDTPITCDRVARRLGRALRCYVGGHRAQRVVERASQSRSRSGCGLQGERHSLSGGRDLSPSLGGVELRMDAWGIDVCVAASQKCLEGPPGTGIVAVGESAWKRIRDVRRPGWYLNLRVWANFAEEWKDWHPFPVTLAVPAFRGLHRGLRNVLEEGLEARWLRHRASGARVRSELKEAGYRPVFGEEIASPTVIALTPPANLKASDLVSRLKSEYRILVAGGMGSYAGRAFRIGNMGPQATERQTAPLIDALRRIADPRKGAKEA